MFETLEKRLNERSKRMDAILSRALGQDFEWKVLAIIYATIGLINLAAFIFV